jgi:cytosolic carboxypeptidase protein 2/3
LGHDQYPSEWKNNILIYDSEKSPRIQEPLIFSHIFSPTLIFESRFESGNLRQVRRRGQFEYELLLRTDLYTEKHTQWFFFKVTNMLPKTTYRFRIINLRKPTSLYNDGLKPLLYSMKHADLNEIGWCRTGHHISYYQNISHRMNPLLKTNETYYELDFQLVCYYF